MFDDVPDSPGMREEEEKHYVVLYRIAWVALAAVAFVTALWLLGACVSESTVAASTYATEQTACLDKPTHAEREACLVRVRALWNLDAGVDAADAGADK